MTDAGARDVAGHALLLPVRTESQGLETGVRTQMERSLGATFGDVVVHSGPASGALAEAFDAAAFTVGRHVVFGPGRFDTTSLRGRSLIAHELGHVVEQRRGGGDLDLGDRLPADVIPLHAGHSEGAARTAAQAALGNTATVAGASGVGVARQTKQEEQSAVAMAPAMSQAMTQPREAAAPAAPVLQLPAGNARTASRTVMKAIEDLTPLPDGRYTTTYLGKTLVMSAEDAEKTRAAARNSLVEVVTRSRRRFDDAVGRYQAQEEVDKEFWFSSKAAHAAAWIGTLGDHEDPGMALALQRPVVQLAELSVQRLVADGRLAAAAEEATRAEAASGRSAALVRIYVDQTIEGAEDMVSGLEFTRDAAFVTLGVLAVVATAGAAAGLAPGVVGVGVGGMSVGTTATVISVGAPIVANVGVGLVKLAEGDPVDWGDIAVDAAIQVVLARFGGKLGEKVFGKLAGNPVARTAVRRVLASVGSGVVSHEASQVFSVTVNETYAALRGRDVSWGHFVDELTDRLTDPKGIFMAAAMSGFQVVAHGAIDKAAAAKAGSSGGGSSKPPPPPGKPPAAPVKQPVVTTQKPPTPVQKTAVTPAPTATVKATASAPKPAKAAKAAGPSALKRKADAGERLRAKAETRAKAAAGQELKASQKVTTAKTRLGAAQDAVEARKQSGRNPTKKQQDAVERAKKAVATSESGHAKASKVAQGAQARLKSAAKVAAARSDAHSKAKAAAASKPVKGSSPMDKFDRLWKPKDIWKQWAKREIAARVPGGTSKAPLSDAEYAGQAADQAKSSPTPGKDGSVDWSKTKGGAKLPGAAQELDPIRGMTDPELAHAAKTGELPSRFQAEIEHRIPQRVGRWMAKAGVPPKEAAAATKLNDPSNLESASKSWHEKVDEMKARFRSGHDRSDPMSSLDTRQGRPLEQASDPEIATMVAALKKPGVNLDVEVDVNGTKTTLRNVFREEKTRRPGSSWVAP